MVLSLLHANAVDKLVVVDIAPRTYAEIFGHLSLARAMLECDLAGASAARDVEQQLAVAVPDKTVRLAAGRARASL